MIGLDDIVADVFATLRDMDVVTKTITYARPSTGGSVSIEAIQSHVSTEAQLGIYVPTNYETDDFIFPVADLVLSSLAALPVVGDTITDADGNVFTVNKLLDQKHYRFADAGQTLLRVHTKQTVRA